MKVSICVPAYKQTEFLKECLDSIANQTYSNYELIVTDDTSGDIVANLVQNYKDIFGDRLKYYHNEKPHGSPGNWNYSLDKATGDLVQLMHHDDFYSNPDSLQLFVDRALKNPGINIFASEVYSKNAATGELTITRLDNHNLNILKNDFKRIFYANLIGPPSVFMLRRNKIRFDSRMKWLVDMEYYFRIFEKFKKWEYINIPLVTSINNANHNVTNECIENPDVEIFEHLYFYNKHFKSLFPSIRMIVRFIKVFRNFGVFSPAQLDAFKRDQKVPFFMYCLTYLLRYHHVFKQD